MTGKQKRSAILFLVMVCAEAFAIIPLINYAGAQTDSGTLASLTMVCIFGGAVVGLGVMDLRENFGDRDKSRH